MMSDKYYSHLEPIISDRLYARIHLEPYSGGRDSVALGDLPRVEGLNAYTHIRPAVPHANQVIRMVIAPATQEEKLTQPNLLGTVAHSELDHVDLTLREVGNLQGWFGGGMAVLWEVIVWKEAAGFHWLEWQKLFKGLWVWFESWLAKQGARKIYAHDFDPAYEDGFYKDFLRLRGYRLFASRWLAKEVNEVNVVNHINNVNNIKQPLRLKQRTSSHTRNQLGGG